jgi:hypothetical protein
VNLTDLWRAAGSDQNKRPVIWIRDAGRAFVEYATNSEQAHLCTKPGRYGGSQEAGCGYLAEGLPLNKPGFFTLIG